MITVSIPELSKRYYIPSDLSECDRRQYVEMSMLLYRFQMGEIDYEAFRVQAVYTLLDFKCYENDDAYVQELKMVNIYQLSTCMDSFFEESEEDDSSKIKQYYINNPIVKVSPLLRNYYGPSDGFENVTFGEYVEALHCFGEYYQSRDNEYLFQLMGVMYRKSKHLYRIKKLCGIHQGDIRQPFNGDSLHYRAEKFKRLYFGEVYGFFLLFASFQKYLCTAKIYVQGRELDLSILFGSGDDEDTSSDLPGLGMRSTLYALAESGVFGSKKELEQENLWEVLMRMYDLTKRDLDYKKKTKTKTTEE